MTRAYRARVFNDGKLLAIVDGVGSVRETADAMGVRPYAMDSGGFDTFDVKFTPPAAETSRLPTSPAGGRA